MFKSQTLAARGINLAKLFPLLMILGSCAHNVLIVGRTNGSKGKATITTAGNKSGDISIELDGKNYTGQWVYVPNGGGFAFGSGTSISGTRVTTVTGNAIALPMQGDGTVLANAPDGSSLRCGFTFSEFGRTGVGTCQDGKGEIYDMQIN